MSLFYSYRDEAHEGYWGPITSQIDFCEENYMVSPYFAELINTLTNLIYVVYAIKGIRKNSGKPDAFSRNMPYLGIASVGIGSAIFHTTMKNYTQWCDDLSMLLATSTVLHQVFSVGKTPKQSLQLGAFIAVCLTAFTLYHCITDELIMHQVAFGLMILTVAIRTRILIRTRLPESATHIKSQVSALAILGFFSFVIGFALWNVDMHVCGPLTAVKRSIGMPFSFILELHGWWHIFTGIGAYVFIALVEYLTHEECGEDLAGRFGWAGWFLGEDEKKVKKVE